MNRLRLSKTNPLLTIFWQVSLVALIVFVITVLTSTDPFDWFFNPCFAFIVGLTVIPMIHALFTPGGLQVGIQLSFGNPHENNDTTDDTSDTSPKKPWFHYEKSESFWLGQRK